MPEGADCTVLGKFSKEGKDVVCNKPKMIFENEKQMMEYIQQSVRSLNIIHVLLVIGLTVSIVWMMREVYRMARSMRRKV